MEPGIMLTKKSESATMHAALSCHPLTHTHSLVAIHENNSIATMQ